MKSPRSLDMWLYGTHVMTLTQDNKSVKGRFTDEVIDRWGLESPILSTSLPTGTYRPSTHQVTSFIDGLLPEGALRNTLARQSSVLPENVFGMIAQYGRDVAGAVTVLPSGESPDPPTRDYEPLDDAGVASMLEAAARHPLGNRDVDGRHSLGGVREKILLARIDGRWHRCLNGSPGTHLLKPPPRGSEADLLFTEPFGLNGVRSTGAPTANAAIATFDGVPALVVERYDRLTDAEGIQRVHQEDACQALGIAPTKKYQSDGGPSLRQIAKVLRTYDDTNGIEDLLRRMVGDAVLGNTDAHAKNISFLHDEDGGIRLAPAYDVAPTLHYRGVTTRGTAAMTIGGKTSLHAVTTEDLVDEGALFGMPSSRSEEIVHDALNRIDVWLHGDAHDVDDDVLDIVATRSHRLRAGEIATDRSTLPPVRDDSGVVDASGARCGQWMPRARARCLLPSGHSEQHRSVP